MRNSPLSLSAFALGVSATVACGQAEAPPVQPLPAGSFVEKLQGTTVEFRMVPIPAGTLKQPDAADPSKTVEVAIPRLFICTTEVTWDMYDIFLFRLDEADPSAPLGADAVSRPSKPYLPADRGFGHSGHPAISVSFHGAKEFCRWLSAKTGRTYRLPTSDEWEYAARGGGSATENPGPTEVDEAAWHAGNSEQKTRAVGIKDPNAWGLHDTLGNVAEWTVGPNGKGLVAGGSFVDAPEAVNPDGLVPYSRAWNESDPQIPKSKWWMADCPFVGFRIVCEPSDAQPAPATKDDSTPLKEPSK